MTMNDLLLKFGAMLQEQQTQQARARREAERRAADQKFVKPPEGAVSVMLGMDLWYKVPSGDYSCRYIRSDQTPAVASAEELGDSRPIKMKGR